ncbi:MAG: Endonuclease/exonuclease/phosphatase [Podila humilis]|nr:MAG: Endonuclease/exonuclease/phosphatase [Podila humilis]
MASSPVVLIGTFNMSQRPIEQDLSDWLSTHPSLSSDAPASPVSNNHNLPDVASTLPATPLIPDIVAVALQEMAPYPDAFIHDTYHLQDKINELANVILRTLHRTCPGYRFSLISQSAQVGMALFILTRDGSMTEYIEKISNASVGTGLCGMGNKGAIATKISVRMPSSSTAPYPQEALQDQQRHDPQNRPFEICIINAHLSAHLNQIQRRNEDYLAICKRMVFFDDRDNQVEGLLEEHQERLLSNLPSSSFSSSVDSFDDSQSDLYQLDNDSRPLLPKKRTPKNTISQNSNKFYQNNTTTTNNNKAKRRNSTDKKDIQWEESIFSCDYIFWTGDLNYRLDLAQSDGSTTKKKKKASSSEYLLSQPTLPDLTASEIVQTIQAGHFRKLYSHDQLSAQRKTMNVFRDFHEAPLAFAPTYKFKMGSNQYDYSKRVPAWTDRVLWYVHPRTESSFDEEKEDELDAWDEHSQGLGVGTLPMESSSSSSGASLAYGRRHDNFSSASTSTAATANQYGGWTGSKSRGTFSSLAKKGSARGGVHPGIFQPPSTESSTTEVNKGTGFPSTISTNSLASLPSRTPMSQSPTSTVGVASSVHMRQTPGAPTTSPLLIHYYTSHPMYQTSDHKPVSALFTLLPQHLANQVGPVPYAIDPTWRRKKWLGKKLTTIVGHVLRWGFVVLGVGLVIGLTVLVRKHLHRW